MNGRDLNSIKQRLTSKHRNEWDLISSTYLTPISGLGKGKTVNRVSYRRHHTEAHYSPRSAEPSKRHTLG